MYCNYTDKLLHAIGPWLLMVNFDHYRKSVYVEQQVDHMWHILGETDSHRMTLECSVLPVQWSQTMLKTHTIFTYSYRYLEGDFYCRTGSQCSLGSSGII